MQKRTLLIITFAVGIAVLGLLNYLSYRKLINASNYDSLKGFLITPSEQQILPSEIFPRKMRLILVVNESGDRTTRLLRTLESIAAQTPSVAIYIVQTTSDHIGSKIPIYRDKGALRERLALTKFPVLLFVDKHGMIVKSKTGESSREYIEMNMRALELGNVQPDPVLSLGKPVRPFTATTFEGKDITLPLPGKETLLVFSENGCNYCSREWSQLSQILISSKTQNAFVVQPSHDPTDRTPHFGPLPVVYVENYKIFEDVGIKTVPSLIWVSSDSRISLFHTGYLGSKRLLKMAQADQAVLTGSAFALGDKIPAFQLDDTSGRVWTENNLKDKKTAIIFGSSRCQSCKQLEEYLEQHPELTKGVNTVHIYTDKKEQLASKARKLGTTFLADEAGIVSVDFDVQVTPTVIIVNPDLSIASVTSGFQQTETRKLLSKIR